MNKRLLAIAKKNGLPWKSIRTIYDHLPISVYNKGFKRNKPLPKKSRGHRPNPLRIKAYYMQPHAQTKGFIGLER